MKRRLVGMACGLWVLAALTVGVGAAPARADAPRDQGWWTATNVAVPGAPVALPALPAGVPASPAAPDVPPGGLLVQGGAAAPTAYSALLYELDQGTTASTLTLAVAPSTLTNPATTLQVCRLLQPINHPEQGGPLTDAPPYDCSHKATAAPTANAYKFDVSGLVADNLVAVAILPTGPVDRVVFSAPDNNSLATTQGAAGTPPADTTGPVEGVPALTDQGVSATPVVPAPSSSNLPGLTAGPSVATPPPVASPRGPAGAGVGFIPVVSGKPAKATPYLVFLLVAGALGGAALWLFAGRTREGAAISAPPPG